MRLSIATDRRQFTDIQRRQYARVKEYFSSISAKCFELKGYQSLRRGPLAVLLILSSSVFSLLLYITIVRRIQRGPAIDVQEQPQPLFWSFPRINTYYDGLRTVASPACPEGTTCTQSKASLLKGKNRGPYPKPFKYNPYLKHQLGEQSDTIQQCSLVEDDQLPLPAVWAYATNSYKWPEPIFGSYSDVGLRDDVCFDRYGRYGAYGLGYTQTSGGTGHGMHGDRHGTEEILPQQQLRDWSTVDLGAAQARCSQLNRHRFTDATNTMVLRKSGESIDMSKAGPINERRSQPRTEAAGRVSRKAVVLRTYQHFEYTEFAKLYIRSLVNELNLGSGGEYDVHLLVEVKNLSAPIWASQDAYQEVLRASVPEEFRSMATLWSEKQMELVYPGPFQPQSCCYGPIHWVVRSMHFALQWFASHHPEYEYFWNWEMDIRYVGHWYEFFDRVSEWAKVQPREGLWERSGRFYIPALHQSWANFSKVTAELSKGNMSDSDLQSLDVSTGVGEDADFLSLDPLFDPEGTDWLYKNDLSGYPNADTGPRPNRRASIVTASRLSRTLLQTMHNETYQNKHTMASEMFSTTMALHHNLKAVYVPHPVFFDRDWPAEYADSIFNAGPGGQTGGYWESVFGGNYQFWFQGSTYYYNSGFTPALWRRWLGYMENGEGGPAEELRKGSGGRMCLRSTLLHPVKDEREPAKH